jgi:hypothetical protein
VQIHFNMKGTIVVQEGLTDQADRWRRAIPAGRSVRLARQLERSTSSATLPV